jgi:hypothetical protein
VLALDDGALAIVLIAATRLAADVDRVRLLERFAERADPPGRRTTNVAPGRRPRPPARSPAAEKQARYRERLRRGVAYVPLPVTRPIVDYLVRSGLLPRDREAADRVEIGLAAAAVLERAARADR